MVLDLNINYKNVSTALCEIGAKYESSKSSLIDLTNNINNINKNCRAYTIFYNDIFNKQRNEKLNLAEIGISNGGSLLMWKEYFKNSKIFGFEYNKNLINTFKKENNDNEIILAKLDVKFKTKLSNTFQSYDEMFDIIIDNSTHEFEDQIRIIKIIYQFLKPGGILILEDINQKYNVNDYILKLNNFLNFFQDYFFVTIDHSRKNIGEKENNKLFVLIKNGVKIFDNKKKITIITPSYRQENLNKIYHSLNFDYIDEWIIVYDTNKVNENINKLYLENENSDKISEYFYKGIGISGNSQRNFGLKKIKNKDTYLYYLDDDNIIHPDFYKILSIIGENKLCTFNQLNKICGNKDKILLGNNIEINKIDTAMFLLDFKLNKLIKWNNHNYNSDGYYIKEIFQNNKNNWIYINNLLCYWNKLNDID